VRLTTIAQWTRTINGFGPPRLVSDYYSLEGLMPMRKKNRPENHLSGGTSKASVIINTYNRADYLRNAVVSIAAQSYDHVELIVVNGPSTDHTEEVLDAIEADGIRITRAKCKNRNLSESRNVGVSLALGDVVLFIDDDAVAHRDWVARLMAPYAAANIGGTGGFTFDHTGVSFQCRYTVCDKFGNARFFDTLDPQTLVAGSEFYFPSLLGTNCSFSRRALERIGGFDEVFEYMLDETDVCVRMIEDAKAIITVPNAYVFHKYAPSATRTLERIPKSLLAPARSKAYFCFKHAKSRPDTALHLEVIAEIERYRKDLDFSNKWFLDHKRISPAHYSRLCQELNAGISDGLRCGVGSAKNPPEPHSALRQEASNTSVTRGFVSVNGSSPPERALRVYFVSQGYPPDDTAGIARWTRECAIELSASGHEVHVITRSQSPANHVDFCDGVWVHSVIDAFDEDLIYPAPVPIPMSVSRRATAVLREIKRSESIWGVDIVSAPIWDVEGILCCAHLNKPVITSLHTTYKLAMQFKPEWKSDLQFKVKHVDKVIAAESWLLENSSAILANSIQVINEIDESYDGILGRVAARVTTVPHGIGAPVLAPPEDGAADIDGVRDHGAKFRILFVGRLEERKGPDQLLSALDLLRPLLGNIAVALVGCPGTESDPYQLKLVQQATRLKKRFPRLILSFPGYVSDDELQEYYAAADVFIAPSRFESFGLVLIEAMRHGTPVIACDVGGMREIIDDGVDGYLFSVGDIARLAARLRLLFENTAVRHKIGEAARQTYESRFTARKMGASIERMLSELTEGFVDE
jgi:glycosyltransferase involved in cell wall biosynthesis